MQEKNLHFAISEIWRRDDLDEGHGFDFEDEMQMCVNNHVNKIRKANICFFAVLGFAIGYIKLH